jgi:glycosyltransferase involved in cell wall biosynthesis
MTKNYQNVSVIIPAKNEAGSIGSVVDSLKAIFPTAEVIVVDDGSTDATGTIAKGCGARVISHRYSKGNGAAIKSGARNAGGEVLVFMDADGQHSPQDVKRLLEELSDDMDMIVGARSDASQAGKRRLVGNKLYNHIASWVVGHKIPDLTSGFRVVRAAKFKEFLYLLPNGFSYPTTITMAFFRAGYSVGYLPIEARARDGKSHIRLLRDGAKFLLIIFKIGTLYSPLKMFLPVSLGVAGTGLLYYLYTYIESQRFTNMSALLFSTSVLIFMMGLISEQITTLIYQNDHREKR